MQETITIKAIVGGVKLPGSHGAAFTGDLHIPLSSTTEFDVWVLLSDYFDQSVNDSIFTAAPGLEWEGKRIMQACDEVFELVDPLVETIPATSHYQNLLTPELHDMRASTLIAYLAKHSEKELPAEMQAAAEKILTAKCWSAADDITSRYLYELLFWAGRTRSAMNRFFQTKYKFAASYVVVREYK